MAMFVVAADSGGYRCGVIACRCSSDGLEDIGGLNVEG